MLWPKHVVVSKLETCLQSITQGGAAEQEVRQEDQQRINTFNKLNTRLHELQAGVKAKKVLESHGSIVSCNRNL